MANKISSATKVVIPCRISFANIFEAKSINGGEAKYSVSCLIPKEDKKTLLAIHKAVEAAKENARLNSLTNCEFIAGDVLKVIDEIEEKPDYIVLDPPRDGIHPKALEKIIRYGVPQMVYISCKPTSLARDLEVLQASGYEVKKVCCVDMFPATVHVESVVLMQYCGK